MEGSYVWTRHSEFKMKQYALSQQRVRRIIRHPDRVEKSIVPRMVAVMQIAGTSKNRQEIWVMYEVVKSQKLQVESKNVQPGKAISNSQLPTPNFKTLSPAQKFRLQRQQEFLTKKGMSTENGKALRIISAWRYPGTSPARDPIPSEILEELQDIVR